MKKRIFSGAQPTGKLHIGNYLGALKNWVALEDDYDALYCIVNLHSVTLPQNPDELRQNTLDLARVYLAAGLDPSRSIIFVQSDVPQHAELAWVLSCNTRMGELERMTQFKDKSRRSRENTDRQLSDHLIVEAVKDIENARTIEEQRQAMARFDEGQKLYQKSTQQAGVGLFTYPVLMAADILLYQTDLVPVGQDQKQHLELCRDIAERFNRDFGETFRIPDPYIPKAGASIKSLLDPGRKMSKSDENANGAIFLTDDADTILKKFKRAVTDSGTAITFDESRPAINNLLTIYQLVTDKTAEECVAHFEGKGYGQFKSELAEAVIEFLRPFQENVKQFDDEHVTNILQEGAEKARGIAAVTLQDVYSRMGIAR